MSKLWNDAKGNVTFVFVCIITFIAVVLLAKLLEKLVMKNGRRAAGARYIAFVAMFSAIGGVLMLLEIPLFFAPSFYKMDLSAFLGMYGACSTMAESIIAAAMLTDGGFSDLAVCGASSHFSSSEREFRYPLEMGTQSPPTAQRTVTGAGAAVIASSEYACEKRLFSHIAITGGTVGRVCDYGITDASNMGAAMAPAAASTICAHLSENGLEPSYYDVIFTGDLGSFGSDMLLELCGKRGFDLGANHSDCGLMIFSKEQKVICGGSGCGCCASVLCSEILPALERGELSRILFVATGALLSPLSSLQGESIPAIAHAAVLERI